MPRYDDSGEDYENYEDYKQKSREKRIKEFTAKIIPAPSKWLFVPTGIFLTLAILAFLFLTYPFSIALGATAALLATVSFIKYAYDWYQYDYKVLDPTKKEEREIIDAFSGLQKEDLENHLFSFSKSYYVRENIYFFEPKHKKYYPNQFLDPLFTTGRKTASFWEKCFRVKFIAPMAASEAIRDRERTGTYVKEGAIAEQRFLLHWIFLRLALLSNPASESQYERWAGDFLDEHDKLSSRYSWPLKNCLNRELSYKNRRELAGVGNQEEARQQVDIIEALLAINREGTYDINIMQEFQSNYSRVPATSIFELAVISGRIPHLKALVDDLVAEHKTEKYTLAELTNAELLMKKYASVHTSDAYKNIHTKIQNKLSSRGELEKQSHIVLPPSTPTDEQKSLPLPPAHSSASYPKFDFSPHPTDKPSELPPTNPDPKKDVFRPTDG